MAELEIHTHYIGRVPTVRLQGDFDSYSATRVRRLLETYTQAEKPTLLVDMGDVEYIDSAGLGVLVAALKQATDRSGNLAIVNPSVAVSRVLRVTGLDTLFSIFNDESEAQRQLHLTAT
jgi:anti-sigma B factor antagonist